MQVPDSYQPIDYIEVRTLSELDTAEHKFCGVCRCMKPVTEFYRDGFDHVTGKPRFRRDCKLCYKNKRQAKKAVKELYVPVTPYTHRKQ